MLKSLFNLCRGGNGDYNISDVTVLSGILMELNSEGITIFTFPKDPHNLHFTIRRAQSSLYHTKHTIFTLPYDPHNFHFITRPSQSPLYHSTLTIFTLSFDAQNLGNLLTECLTNHTKYFKKLCRKNTESLPTTAFAFLNFFILHKNFH